MCTRTYTQLLVKPSVSTIAHPSASSLCGCIASSCWVRAHITALCKFDQKTFTSYKIICTGDILILNTVPVVVG